MKTVNDLTVSVDELAGHWTEPALHLLKGAGVQQVSVDMEVETWRTLEKVLRSELRYRPSFRFSTASALNCLKEQVLCKATALVARQFGSLSISNESVAQNGFGRSQQTDFTLILRSPALDTAL